MAAVDADTAAHDRARAAAASIRHPLTVLLLTLTFSTGLVDAVSYLGLGRVFSANMTGNVVLLGFGIAGGYALPIVAPIVSLVLFLVGAMLGGRLADAVASRHRVHLGAALGAEVAVLAAAALLTALAVVRPDAASGDTVIGMLALAMGLRNATVRRLGVPDLTTTVLTLTLTGLASDLRHLRGHHSGTVRRLCAVVAMLVGALIGGLLLKTGPAWVLALAAVLAAVTGAIYLRHPSSGDPA
ncbi:MAG TPA: YoaK family protein [Solirubrobacteraceae bacterium]|nr:YoaK family protein [Solirubrobacteraceae bacterium]